MNQKLLDKYLNHEASEAEINQLRKDPETSALWLISDRAKALKTVGFTADKNWAVILAHHQNSQRTRSGEPAKQKQHPFGQVFHLPKVSRPMWQLVAVALVLLGAYFFLNQQTHQLITPNGTHQQWTLPDGSGISLNAGSKAGYNESSWSSHRVVELQGEAFFDVIKGSTFEVQTANGVVTVLGTEFNILTRDDDFYVSCFEGLVKVQTADTTLQLPAGYGVRIFGGMFNYIAQENIGTKPLWMIGESHFSTEPLALVLDEVTRQYDVTFTFDSRANNLAQSAQFSGSFPHDDLELTLKSICQPFGLVFDLEGDQIRLTLNNDPKDP